MKEVICYCSNVSKANIWNALENGARTLEDIRRITGACTVGNCQKLSPHKRCCSPNILAIIDEYLGLMGSQN